MKWTALNHTSSSPAYSPQPPRRAPLKFACYVGSDCPSSRDIGQLTPCDLRGAHSPSADPPGNQDFEQEDRECQVLRKRAGTRFTVDAQVSTHLGYEQKVPMRPDIVVSEGETMGLVAGCKYKRLEPGEFKNHDVY